MRYNILIGGRAGQGINRVSGIVSKMLTKLGYFIFNYRDYQSLIRGGHSFNVLSVSDKMIASHESKLDGIVHLDDRTLSQHKGELKEGGFVISYEGFEDLKMNLNVALAGALIRALGIDKKVLLDTIRAEFDEEAVKAAEKGFESQKENFKLKRLSNKIKIMSGSQAVAQGAINSKIDLYIGYPMTPSTGLLHALAARQKEKGYMVFQPESEIAAINAGLGASYAGAKTMIGTSGGGYDLMSEGLSLQGQTAVPLVVYLAARPGPATGVPTYVSQGDLDIALRAGHGEFPRIVVAPGDPVECIEKTNEAFYLSEKFGALTILLSDKQLAESEYSLDRKENKILKVEIKRKVPGEAIVKVSSYESGSDGNSTEEAELVKKNVDERLKRYEMIKQEVKNFEMIKIHGKKSSKNLVVAWGSTKGVILDAISGLDIKFLQVLYMKPMSREIKKEIEKAENVVLVESNVTGQLGRLIREKTGLKINNRILRYDTRPFRSDELREELKGVLLK